MELNKIYNEDCLEGMKKIPDNSIDLVVTSPPYEDLRKYKGFSFDFNKTSEQLFRVIKNGGCLVWIINDKTINGSESGNSFRQALHFINLGFKLHDTMIFAKNNPVPLTHRRYEQAFEYMFIFVKGKLKTFNPIMRINKNAGKPKTGTHRRNGDDLEQMKGVNKIVREKSISNNIWFYSVNRGAITSDNIAHKHSAIFPEQLAIDHILSWSNEKDVILDPFMGSGTTAIACLKTNRNYIGFEISEEYCNIANERIKNHVKDKQIELFEMLDN